MAQDKTKMVSASIGQFEEAFAEWDKRWREHPEEFVSIVEHLLRGTPATYGASCSVYFAALLEELAAGWIEPPEPPQKAK